MELTKEPRLSLPRRTDHAKTLERAGDILGQFRRELDEIKAGVERVNSSGLQGLIDGFTAGATPGYNQDTSTQPYTLQNANAYVPLSLNRILLNYTYMTQGLVRTLVDQPVEDAFRGGLKFKSAELD